MAVAYLKPAPGIQLGMNLTIQNEHHLVKGKGRTKVKDVDEVELVKGFEDDIHGLLVHRRQFIAHMVLDFCTVRDLDDEVAHGTGDIRDVFKEEIDVLHDNGGNIAFIGREFGEEGGCLVLDDGVMACDALRTNASPEHLALGHVMWIWLSKRGGPFPAHPIFCEYLVSLCRYTHICVM